MYLIEILHQTTTLHRLRYANARLYLIEILHQTTTFLRIHRQSPELYLIEILHQTTTLPSASRSMACCILSKFYIKPQLIPRSDGAGYVVSYRNSTSNHNSSAGWRTPAGLYLIEILHQTTTVSIEQGIDVRCILSKFYIKPQLALSGDFFCRRCILSKFYIKPQQISWKNKLPLCCILSKFYIKPQPCSVPYTQIKCCILSKFYIKPQLPEAPDKRVKVVSYRNSTSNHNLS